MTPVQIAEEYFNAIKAPRKELVRLDGGGHFAVWSHAAKFGAELVQRVRSLAR